MHIKNNYDWEKTPLVLLILRSNSYRQQDPSDFQLPFLSKCTLVRTAKPWRRALSGLIESLEQCLISGPPKTLDNEVKHALYWSHWRNSRALKKDPVETTLSPTPPPKSSPSSSHKLPPSLTFLSINVIQEVDRVLHHTVTDITVIPSKQKKQHLCQI